MRMEANMLPDGRRLHLRDGPIDLIIGVDGKSDQLSLAYRAALMRFQSILDELCAELPLLRSHRGIEPQGAVARAMWKAILPYRAERFITPMAAVAGAVAEEILHCMVEAAELERAYVNNGGDIAFHLGPNTALRVGLVDRPERPSLFGTLVIAASDAIRGVATSGWSGRSFSLGIADAVTVLAPAAAMADAAATVIANDVDLPGHPLILRRSARELQPDSDLEDRLVTVDVKPLTPKEIATALGSGETTASQLMSRGLITAAALHLQGETRIVGNIDQGDRAANA